MSSTETQETFRLSPQPSADKLQAEISVPTSFNPLPDIVPLMRSLGKQALSLEEEKSRLAEAPLSWQEGCSTCCRLLGPASLTEAFSLKKWDWIKFWDSCVTPRIHRQIGRALSSIKTKVTHSESHNHQTCAIPW